MWPGWIFSWGLSTRHEARQTAQATSQVKKTPHPGQGRVGGHAIRSRGPENPRAKMASQPDEAAISSMRVDRHVMHLAL